MRQIMMIDPSLQRHMLAHPHNHLRRRGNVDNWRREGIDIRNPDVYGEMIDCAPKGDGQCADKVEEESGGAILKGWTNIPVRLDWRKHLED